VTPHAHWNKGANVSPGKGVAIGLATGTILGVIFDNLTYGISLGPMLGVVFATTFWDAG